MPRDPLAGVVLWRAELEVAPKHLLHLAATLSPDEEQRAERFGTPELRHCFVVRRGLLRALLASYVDVAPARIVFTYGPYGKPALSLPGSSIAFSASHTGTTALFAIVDGSEVGVDVETVRPELSIADLAKDHCTGRERAALHDLDDTARIELFTALWARKEAVAKALGAGLSLPLDRIDVLDCPSAPAIVLGGRPVTWVVRDIALGPPFRAAAAIDDRAIGVRSPAQRREVECPSLVRLAPCQAGAAADAPEA